jgi:Putative ER transporter, 6TM, N-terminal
MLPLTFHTAIALILSLGLFPTSESAVFTERLQSALSFIVSATKELHKRLEQDVTTFGFSATPIAAAVSKAESALALLASAARLQRMDVVYCRFAPSDYTLIHVLTRQLIVKAGGVSVYYTLIDPTREKFTPAPSISATPTLASPSHSLPASSGQDQPSTNKEDADCHGIVAETKRHQHDHHHHVPQGQRHTHYTGVHHRQRRHSLV